MKMLSDLIGDHPPMVVRQAAHHQQPKSEMYHRQYWSWGVFGLASWGVGPIGFGA